MLPVDEILAFQRFRLSIRRRELRLDDGTEVKLVGKPFDLLVTLIDHRDRVMSQAEILAVLDGGEVKSVGIFGVRLANLRAALKPYWDHDPILMMTGKGYQFVDEVERVAPPRAQAVSLPPLEPPPPAPVSPVPVPQGARARLGIAVGAACLIVAIIVLSIWRGSQPPATPPLSLVVLPFHNFSEAGGSGFMADAITQDLTTDLAQMPGSVVISQQSAEVYRGRIVPTSQIGRELKVRYILTGSLRVDESGAHVDAWLAEAASGANVWSRRFDVAKVQLGTTEATIVRDIASALNAVLPGIVVAHPRPDDPEAEEAFYRALSIMATQDTPESYGQAVALLERAVALEPDFGDALAQLGLALVLKVRSAEDPTEGTDLAKARDVIGRALSQSHDAAALIASARLAEAEENYAGAVANAKAALALEPNSAEALATLAKCATVIGDLDGALTNLRRLLEVNPDPAQSGRRLALFSQIYLLQGKYPEAIDYARQALAGEPPPSPGTDTMGRTEYATLLLISATALSGDGPQATALYDAYRNRWSNRSAWRIAAYSPAQTRALNGFSHFVEGLTKAGMPLYAGAAPRPVSAEDRAAGSDFYPSPLEIDGAVTIDTSDVKTLVEKRGVFVLDVGDNVAAPPAAIWLPPRLVASGGPKTWLSETAGVERESILIVMSNGAYGLQGAHVTRQLVAAGYRHVKWYRGGEEAWAQATTGSPERR